MTDRTRLLILQIGLVLGVSGFLFFFGLGAFGLVGADEPRYAQIAREMFQRHDWVVPTLNNTPWLEKPILLYWKIINSYRILGVHDWAARVPSAAHAVILVLAIFFFMRRFRPGNELDAALIVASCPGVFVFARGASTDMPLAVHFCLAILSWWTWHQTGQKIWLAGFYAFLALGALAKGPVAPALALLIIGIYSSLRRDRKILMRSLWWLGFALFFAIALPWYVAIQLRVPQFFRVFFIEHNLERFGTNLYHHAQPFWFYVPWFLIWVLPWLAFALPALTEAARQGVHGIRDQAGKDSESLSIAPDQEASSVKAVGDKLSLFLLVWIAVPIVFFSISRSKLPGYILPAIPPSALLTADYLRRRQAFPRWQLMLHSLLCGAILCVALLVPWFMIKQPVPQTTGTIIAIAVGVIAILVLVMLRRGGSRFLHFATLLPVVLALAFILRPAAPIIDQANSARAVDARLGELGVGRTSLAVFSIRRDLAYGLNFYRDQPVTYYEAEGPRDLAHGIPPEEHVVITKAGNGDAVQAAVGPREVKALGGFPPQHLEFFLVSRAR